MWGSGNQIKAGRALFRKEVMPTLPMHAPATCLVLDGERHQLDPASFLLPRLSAPCTQSSEESLLSLPLGFRVTSPHTPLPWNIQRVAAALFPPAPLTSAPVEVLSTLRKSRSLSSFMGLVQRQSRSQNRGQLREAALRTEQHPAGTERHG